jgi:hypothetical protein
MASILDEIKTGDIGNNTRNGFFDPVEANYKVRIEMCKNKPATDNSGPAFIAELEVLESDNPNIEPGDYKDWYRGVDGKTGIQRKMAAKDLVTFLCAAAGFDPDVAGDKERFFNAHGNGSKLLAAAGDDNALDGALLNLRTYTKKTKAGGDFTVHCWSPCKDAPAKSIPADPPAGVNRAADPYEGMQRDESGTLAWNGEAWIVMATGEAA